MLDTFAGVLVIAFWVVFPFGVLTLFVLRLVTALMDKRSFKDTLRIVLIPLSIGYYMAYGQTGKTKVYTILMIVFISCAVLASGWMFFIRF